MSETQLEKMEERIIKKMDNTERKVDKMHSRLFVDNSSPCFQTKLDRNTRWISGVSWAIGIIYAAAIGTIAWIFKK